MLKTVDIIVIAMKKVKDKVKVKPKAVHFMSPPKLFLKDTDLHFARFG